jgi:hypothetical protein
MLSRRSVFQKWQTATQRIVVCCGLVVLLSLLGFLGFGVLQRMHAAENILPDRQVSAAATKSQPRLAAGFGRLPLSFEANQGQSDGRVRFLARGAGYTIFLTDDEAVLSLHKGTGSAPRFGSARAPVAQHPLFGAAGLPDRLSLWKQESETEVEMPRDRRAGPALPFSSRGAGTSGEAPKVLRMHLVGANAGAAVTGADELPDKSNYFIGKDPKKWRTNVPNYAKVKLAGVYPGVDLVYYGNQGGQLEYDFVVAPGADPKQIKLTFPGADGVRVDAASGDLVLKLGEDEVRFQKPFVYQPARSAASSPSPSVAPASSVDPGHPPQITRPSSFVLETNGQVGVRIEGYDPHQALVIDPVLSYSTYLGGSAGDGALAIAVDSSGNAYLTGYTSSPDFPTMNPIEAADDAGPWFQTAFVAKLNATGSALVYSTYLGGSYWGQGNGIAVDSSGNAYVAGYTYSRFRELNVPVESVNGYRPKLDAHDCGRLSSGCAYCQEEGESHGGYRLQHH